MFLTTALMVNMLTILTTGHTDRGRPTPKYGEQFRNGLVRDQVTKLPMNPKFPMNAKRKHNDQSYIYLKYKVYINKLHILYVLCWKLLQWNWVPKSSYAQLLRNWQFTKQYHNYKGKFYVLFHTFIKCALLPGTCTCIYYWWFIHRFCLTAS